MNKKFINTGKILFKAIFLSLIFYSCSVYDYLRIDTLEPAKVTISPGVDTVVMVIKKNNNPLNINYRFTNKYYKHLIEIMPSYYYEGMKDFNKYSGRLFIKDSVVLRNLENPLKPLNNKTVKSICKKYGVKNIISLSYYNVIDSNIYQKPYNTGNYNPESLRGNTKVTNRTLWRLYSEDGLIIDNNKIENHIILDNYPPKSYVNVNIKNIVYNSSYNSSVSYFTRISPIWKLQQRKIYSYASGYLPIMEAAKLASKGNWDDAEKIWKKFADSNDKSLSARSAFNLAVANEVKDNLDRAIYWAFKSNEIKETTVAKKYIEALKKRIKEKEIVIEQIK